MGVSRNFSTGGQSRHFAYRFQVIGDATQMDVYKKVDVQRYGNCCIQCFLCKKTLHWVNHKLYEILEQGYSNGGPRSESGPLVGDGGTSSASQRCILYPEIFIPKFCTFGRTSKAFTSRQLCDCRSSCCSAKLQCTPELGKLRFFGSK